MVCAAAEAVAGCWAAAKARSWGFPSSMRRFEFGSFLPRRSLEVGRVKVDRPALVKAEEESKPERLVIRANTCAQMGPLLDLWNFIRRPVPAIDR